MPDEDKLDQLLKGLGAVATTIESITTRLDSVDKRFDAAEEEKKEERKDAAKKRSDAFKFSKRGDGESDEDFKKRGDAEEEEHRKDMMEAGEPEASAMDKAKKARKDAEDEKEEKKEEKDDAEDEKKEEKKEERDDSAFESRLTKMREDIARDLEAKFRPMSRDDEAKYTAVQARWDDVYSLYGERAPRPLHGQSVLAYERQLASKMQSHSRAFKDVDLTVAACDEAAFIGIAAEILHSARADGLNPATAPVGTLRMQEKNEGGHTTRTYVGHPSTWMNDFAPIGQTVVELNRHSKRSN